MPISGLSEFGETFQEKATNFLNMAIKHASNIPFGDGELSDIHSRKELLDHYDITSARSKKRIRAVLDHIGDFYQHLGDVADRKSIEHLAIYSNGLIIIGGYNKIDRCREISLAAAIWILDQLNLQDDLNKLYDLLPNTPEGSPLCSIIDHPQYDNELMSSLVQLLIYRNKPDYSGVGPFESTLVSDKGKGIGQIRDTYEAVIALLDPKAIQNAINKYEKKMWEFYRVSFQAEIRMLNEEYRLRRELDQLNKSFINENVEKENPLLLLKSKISSAPIPDTFGYQTEEISEKRSMLIAEIQRLAHSATLVEFGLVNRREKIAKRFKDVIGNRLAQELCEFSVDDPFEMAFVLFYLLDTDNYLPWLYYGGISVAYTTRDQLPFSTNYVQISDKVYWADVNRALYRHRFKGYRWEDTTDCDGEPIERDKGKNLSQLLCASTHMLLPRIAYAKESSDSTIDELDVVSEGEKELYKILFYILSSMKYKPESLQTYRMIHAIRELEENHTDDIVSDTMETEQLQESISNLNKQNKSLNKALYEESRLKRDAQQRLNHQEQKIQQLRRELADLRELIFLQQNPEEETKNQERDIQFPIHTNSRIISFGGHPSWLKEMKKRLPDVVFYSSDVIPNRDVIQSAEEVWVQTQYFSHAAFYRIVNSIGAGNVQMHYFVSSSAENCARQMVETWKQVNI